jgi:hypothetical protein
MSGLAESSINASTSARSAVQLALSGFKKPIMEINSVAHTFATASDFDASVPSIASSCRS